MQVIERTMLLPSTKVADHHIFHLRDIHGKGNFELAGKWNDRWKAFFQQNPKATAKDAYQFAGKLMDEYKLNKEILHDYRK
jgi:hypothetical protein